MKRERARGFDDAVAAGIVFSAATLYLQLVYWRGAGPPWRDEIDTLSVAQSPWPHFFDRLEFSPFPMLWPLVVRGWTSLFGDATRSLRTLGLIVAISLLAAIWFAMRTLGARAPMLAIALGGAAATVVRYGGSLRAYGFGAVLGLLSMALLYRTCLRPTPASFALAAAASVAAANVTYQNAPLLLACCVAAAIVHRDKRRAAIVLAIGALAAASLLVNVPNMRKVAQWDDLVRYDVDLSWIAGRFRDAADLGGGADAAAWCVLLPLALGAAVFLLRRARAANPAMLFCAIALAVYTVAQIAFLLFLGYLMQVWYCLIFMVGAAVMIDAIAAHAAAQWQWLHLGRAGAALFLMFIAFDGTRAVVGQRMTDVDVIAERLDRAALPNDYIVVYPWHVGTSFQHYYHGAAPWQTLPPLADHSVQRYDEAHAALFDTRERIVIANAVRALRGGWRVWYVGFPLHAERDIYVHEQTRMNLRVEADERWCNSFESAMRAEHVGQMMVVGPQPNTRYLENVALVSVYKRR